MINIDTDNNNLKFFHLRPFIQQVEYMVNLSEMGLPENSYYKANDVAVNDIESLMVIRVECDHYKSRNQMIILIELPNRLESFFTESFNKHNISYFNFNIGDSIDGLHFNN